MSCCLKHSDKIRPNDRGNNTQGREQNLENTSKGNFHKCTTSKVKIITREKKYEYRWLHKNQANAKKPRKNKNEPNAKTHANDGNNSNHITRKNAATNDALTMASNQMRRYKVEENIDDEPVTKCQYLAFFKVDQSGQLVFNM